MRVSGLSCGSDCRLGDLPCSGLMHPPDALCSPPYCAACLAGVGQVFEWTAETDERLLEWWLAWLLLHPCAGGQ